MSVMTRMNRLGLSLVFAALTLVSVSSETRSQSLPNPYRMVDSWAQMPEGREMGAFGDIRKFWWWHVHLAAWYSCGY